MEFKFGDKPEPFQTNFTAIYAIIGLMYSRVRFNDYVKVLTLISRPFNEIY